MPRLSRLFVAVVAVLVLTPVAAVAQPRAVTTVPVLTYNIHHAQGVDGILDLERIATVIARSGAAVVGLQEAPEIKQLTAVLKDTWPEVGFGLGLTSPALLPLRRIDYVLHSADFRATSARTPTTYAADHLPVVATFEL